MHKVIGKVHHLRFELFFVSLMLVLFGAVIFPPSLFESVLMPIFIIINILSGTLLVMHSKRNVSIVLGFTLILLLLFMTKGLSAREVLHLVIVRYLLLCIFYGLVSYELIRQVWKAEDITGNIILGMMSGFVCLGLLSYFAFIAVEVLHPGSFTGIPGDMTIYEKSSELMNFSFVTLLTVGYGDVSPDSIWAQKLAVLTALFGQFYLVIVTAVVIGKFLNKKL